MTKAKARALVMEGSRGLVDPRVFWGAGRRAAGYDEIFFPDVQDSPTWERGSGEAGTHWMLEVLCVVFLRPHSCTLSVI